MGRFSSEDSGREAVSLEKHPPQGHRRRRRELRRVGRMVIRRERDPTRREMPKRVSDECADARTYDYSVSARLGSDASTRASRNFGSDETRAKGRDDSIRARRFHHTLTGRRRVVAPPPFRTLDSPETLQTPALTRRRLFSRRSSVLSRGDASVSTASRRDPARPAPRRTRTGARRLPSSPPPRGRTRRPSSPSPGPGFRSSSPSMASAVGMETASNRTGSAHRGFSARMLRTTRSRRTVAGVPRAAPRRRTRC